MQTNTEIDPKILSRIQKLMALARDGGATEPEAALALDRAQALMLEHNLTMATLEASGAQGEERIRAHNNKKLMFKWKRELLERVAKVNFCALHLKYTNTRAGESIVRGYELIGRQSNVIATRNMHEYLLGTIERLVINEVGTNPQERGSKYAHSFRVGCSNRLRDRLWDRYRDRKREQEAKTREERQRQEASGTNNALTILLSDYEQAENDENTDFLYGRPPGTTAQRRRELNDQWEREQRETEARKAVIKAQNPGISDDVLRLMMQGFTRERAEELCKPDPRKEERDRRRDEAWWRTYHARQQREENRYDQDALQRGRTAADSVGLDEQINAKKQGRLS